MEEREIVGRHEQKDKRRDHSRGFDLAIENALSQLYVSGGSEEVNYEVTLEVTVRPNPGGVTEYRVKLKT